MQRTEANVQVWTDYFVLDAARHDGLVVLVKSDVLMPKFQNERVIDAEFERNGHSVAIRKFQRAREAKAWSAGQAPLAE
jgi:hypothetical protein